MLVTAVPIERDPLPEPIVKAPSRVPPPTFAESATEPVPFAVKVSACEPALVALMVEGIERLASLMANSLEEQFGFTHFSLTLHKPQALGHATDVAVVVTRPEMNTSN